jgi:hypothetical protein
MASGYAKAVNTLFNYFDTKIVLTSYATIPYRTENQETGELSKGTVPWMVLSLSKEVSNQVEIGRTKSESTMRHLGFLYIQIFVRAGTGVATAQTIGDAIVGIFASFQISYDSENGVIRNRNTPFQDPVGNDEEGWYQHLVTVPYYRDHIGG